MEGRARLVGMKMNRFVFTYLYLLLALSSSLGVAQESSVKIPGKSESDQEDQPVVFFDAKSTGFTQDGKQQVFDGDVIAVGTRSIVTADKITVDQENHVLFAEGHVVILAVDQILIGNKIDYHLDTGDFRVQGAQMIMNDKVSAERIAKDVLGFTIEELSFESDRSSRLAELEGNKTKLKEEVRRQIKLGRDADQDQVFEYAKYLQQEELIQNQVNPAFAHMSEARRKTLKKRRDFWEKSKVSERFQGDSGRTWYLKFEGDHLVRTNGNDYTVNNSLFTPCKCDADETPAWGVRASSTKANVGGYATFEDAFVEVKGVPVLYLPWLKLPIKDKRQSGFLPASYTENSSYGSGYSQPLFLDLGVDKDVTVKADVLETRGLKGGAEFRWKRRAFSGLTLNVEGMRDRIWLQERATRRDLGRMYTDGLDNARRTPAGTPPRDLSAYVGREYTRARLAERDWWQSASSTSFDTIESKCLSPNENDRLLCEAALRNSTRVPSNVNRGMAKWRMSDRLGPRIAFSSAGEVYSDRQYNTDLYIPEAISPAFDTSSGERAITPARSRLTYDGSQYFLGLGSYMGDPVRRDDRFEGYQLPAVVQTRTRWHLLGEGFLPLYVRASAENFRVLRERGQKDDLEARTNWLPGGNWTRGELSFSLPLTERSAVGVEHFADIEGRSMVLDRKQENESSDFTRVNSLASWKTGLRFQLPIDGKSALPSWLSGSEENSGTRMIQHLMNWSMTLTTRPAVRRRGTYGEISNQRAYLPTTWFATDREGGEKNIPPTEFMSEYQIVTFATSHRWKLFRELWQKTPGANSQENEEQLKKLTFEERARRELLSTSDKSIRGADQMFSEDQTEWFGNRYQLLESDYSEPLSFETSISYDRLKEVKRAKEGRTRDNRPWSELESVVGLNVASWAFTFGSSYNIYDKVNSTLTSKLLPPAIAKTNVALEYKINKSPFLDSVGSLQYETTKERLVTVVTSLTSPLITSWAYKSKDSEKLGNLVTSYGHKETISYDSPSGCWGIGFARDKDYGKDESQASYLLKLYITFMGQTTSSPDLSPAATRELNKS